jgi:hypothetical protein
MEEIMAEKLDLKEMVTLEELILSNVYTQEALITLLVKKGLITNEELIEEIKRLKIKHQKNYDK